jgi:16S rRNA (uracil1498-N3)-methyltransferase
MGATPAWPPRSTPRLFVEAPLAPGALTLSGAQAHYLVSVMRMKTGDPVKLFDGASGEWLAVATVVARRDVTLDVQQQLAPLEHVPDLWLCAAPLKKGRVDWMAEKACELGVARLVPVVTRRTVVDKPNTERLAARRRARHDPGIAASDWHRARPPHPARRHRGGGGDRTVDGVGG